jgi:ATP-binding cassette subfamily C protein LapB
MFAMQVYDRVVPTLAFQTLYSLVVGVSIIYATDFLLKIMRSRLLDKKSSHIDKELADKVYSHLLSARTDMLPNQLGTLTAQISGIDSVRQFFTSSIVFALVDLPFSIFFLATIYFIGGPIAGAYLAFFIVSLIIGFIAQKRSQSLIKKLTMRSNEKMGVLVDSIRGLETIKVNGYERHLQQAWNNINQSVSEYSLAQKHISNFATTVSQSLGSFSYAAAIMIGVHQIEAGNMTMGAMIACSILGGRVLGPVGQAVSYLIQFETVQQSADLVNKFLEVPIERDDEKSFVFPTTKPKFIEFMDVQYAYEGAQINQVDVPSFTVESGERIAILGKIGSGKSTLLKMLAGLYKPSHGLIKFDSAEIWSLDKRYLNRHIGYLPQQAELFKGTLLDNISMNRKISDTRILEVVNKLELNQITDRNEKGLDLPINEGGSGLSGGQRQMVALARIFAQAPSIWLLDEPTSSIDQELQKVFKEQLSSELSETDIVVFSTHNPKLAMELATRIIIMDGGKIIKDVPTSKVELRHPKVA